MNIKKLDLINFKNYEDLSIRFSDKINCIVGPNGSGKTNILDAIYYLSMTKGAHNTIDSQNVKIGTPYFSIKGQFDFQNKTKEVICYFQEGSKKSFKVDKQDYERLAEHIGKFPVVIITPYDTDVIREGSETRRKFFDSIMCQLEADYLNHLLKYNHNLKQRNAALKQFNKSRKVNHDLLEQYDQVLISYGTKIHEARIDFLKEFMPAFLKNYAFITNNHEQVEIKHDSNLYETNFNELLKSTHNKDVMLERTTLGIHKDDFKFLIDGQPLKKFGSQGQQKSFSIALKLAQYQIIKEKLRLQPILLLDDIFDKLDTARIKKLLQLVIDKTFGQVFITDARVERTMAMMQEFNLDAYFIYIENGVVLKNHEETQG